MFDSFCYPPPDNTEWCCPAVMVTWSAHRYCHIHNRWSADHNELFEMADESLVSRFINTLGALSFLAFYVIFAVVILSLPLILIASDYVNSVVTPYSYFTVFFGGIVLILTLVYLKCRKPYLAWISSGKIPKKPNEDISKVRRKMSMVQIVLTFLAGVLFVIAPYFDYNPNESTFLYTVVILIGLACLLVNIISFVVFLIHQKLDRTALLVPGIRNILFIPSALLVSEWHSIGWHSYAGDTGIQRYDLWQTEYLWYALALAAIVLILFSLLDIVVNKRRKNV